MNTAAVASILFAVLAVLLTILLLIIRKEEKQKALGSDGNQKQNEAVSDNQPEHDSMNDVPRFCTQCGQEMPEGSMFCPFCGEKQQT